jgi:1-acyl-sn-glycerol-3-phosphate acyltransferase
MKNPLSYLSDDLNGLSGRYKRLIIKTYLLVLGLILTIALPHFLMGIYYFLTKNRLKQYREFIKGSVVWGHAVVRLTKSKVHFSNHIEVPDSGHMILLNHINELDFPFDCIAVSKPFLANQAIKSSVFAYWWMSAMGSQVFDTSQQRTIASSVRNLMDGLKEKSYIVYPEGSNSYSEDIKPLKKGMIKLAYENKVPVLILVKSGIQKFQEVQENLTIGYKSAGILDPNSYTSWEDFRDAIYNKMVETKKSLDEDLEKKTPVVQVSLS